MLPLFRMVKSKYNYFGAIYDTCSPTQTARVTRGTVLRDPGDGSLGQKSTGEPSPWVKKVPENRPRGLVPVGWLYFCYTFQTRNVIIVIWRNRWEKLFYPRRRKGHDRYRGDHEKDKSYNTCGSGSGASLCLRADGFLERKRPAHICAGWAYKRDGNSDPDGAGKHAFKGAYTGTDEEGRTDKSANRGAHPNSDSHRGAHTYTHKYTNPHA